VLDDAAESEALARSVDSSDGVVFVPALTGLGSPWWDADARGLISGITRGTTRAHLVRAALEAIAHQVADVADVLPERPAVLRADGGATANGFLMQLQADLLGVPVEVAAERETTALGAAALALGRGARVAVGATYEPALDGDLRVSLRAAWRTALNRSRT
jgi:glycerol kinase